MKNINIDKLFKESYEKLMKDYTLQSPGKNKGNSVANPKPR